MHNPLKKRLQNGEIVIGTFVGLGHPDVTEWLSHIGFDWLLLDAEHGPLGFETLQRMMQSMSGTSCVPIVRPQWNDLVVIKRVLDIGAYGVLVPWVESKEEAEYAVRACRYPPQGVRGYGPRRAAMFDPAYYETANKEILVVVQIETKKALMNLDEILSVEGIDACFIGPNDLSSNLGLGLPLKWNEPQFLEAFDRVLQAAKKWGKPAGMWANLDNIEWAIKKGFRLNTIDNADIFLNRSARVALEKAQSAIKAYTNSRKS